MSKQDGSGRQVTAAPTADTSASILHLDMDAFFASVELLERPELRGRPVIVGHRGARSVVTAATYEARRYGVNSAMPMALALRRCPNAIVLEPHYDRYQHFSREVMRILGDATPLVEPLSIDEAFLDVRGAVPLFGPPFAIATALRERIRSETGLTASVGAAATKFVAKLASSRAKPDGLLVVPEADTIAFLHPQPITALWGVGASTEERLARLGLRTIGDLAATPLDSLRAVIGEAGAARLHELAWGRDPRAVTPGRDEKSIGHEVTFERDVSDADALDRELLRLSTRVAERLRRGGWVARTVAVKIRFGDFRTITRSRTLAEPSDVAERLSREARALLGEARPAGTGIRLIGVRAENLLPAGSVARGLWDDDEPWRETETTLDAVAERFGRGAIQRASLLAPGERRRSALSTHGTDSSTDGAAPSTDDVGGLD
ncbi:DNA polymerase IV [Yonghaparkia sp. Root332]|uniref:DNA polymerase IV n=1 Tax=Yonghaparkia sp. Root332 TaxID=1736516 RepID=UPI0006F2DC31|nr:DNA polymerase IV [Yonghaparkia sp. Root332]KQV25077.1 DNA polymerase IV [Yonghaparkia sp. Root332]